ncbi:TetR/AcrR family transcriptional regulator [uncultured Amaricoccus sp.]|uniref:TetR/AcrR family transcriptional regulator n=1 Tax=uncultured Amaricoccus sp. TaxID=339341 RepID=UPI00260C90A9|nr:TetR/AcrR family transcriptional regulator [uncultured Amaricoccus sp.]
MMIVIIVNSKGWVIVKITREQVELNRAHVIDTAATLFRERGIDGIGIADLMKAAGMTHGGFYRQFRSKNDLAAQAVAHAVEGTSSEISAVLDGADDPLSALVRFYVSPEHRDAPSSGCSLATLAIDAARSTDPALQALFGDLIGKYIALLTTLVPGDGRVAREEAIATLAEMVGAIILSRAVTDRATSDEILRAVVNDLLTRHAE